MLVPPTGRVELSQPHSKVVASWCCVRFSVELTETDDKERYRRPTRSSPGFWGPNRGRNRRSAPPGIDRLLFIAGAGLRAARLPE